MLKKIEKIPLAYYSFRPGAMINTLLRTTLIRTSSWFQTRMFEPLNFYCIYFFFKASLACKSWYRLAFDELLWKGLFHRHWEIRPSIPLAPGKHSWVQEYKRLFYHTPAIQSEVFKVHKDEVLHVSFSHSGKMFATTSKDSSIKVKTFNRLSLYSPDSGKNVSSTIHNGRLLYCDVL